ncbi:MAG: hypothetical protein Q7U66_08930 [Methylobacter sp.]|nr:hypothetical protein [Methylobacter sp.]
MSIALIGVAIVLTATLGGIVIVRRNSPQQPIQVKAVLFGLYFWGLVFLQLALFGLFLG